MKLNLLINPNESIKKGPGRRARNLCVGLDRLGVEYEICSNNFEHAFGVQAGCVFNRLDKLPNYTPIGPNVIHEPAAHNIVASKFNNFVVQSDWVAEYWKWNDPERTKNYSFHVYPGSVIYEDWDLQDKRKPSTQCLFYTKYQSKQNRELAEKIYTGKGHSAITIEYGNYTADELKRACINTEYCIFNSCCEKSSNALMEIMATGLPVYVIDNKKWIGDDSFDRCTSAPHFSQRSGTIGDYKGMNFDDFYHKVKTRQFDPAGFVADYFTVEKVAKRIIEMMEVCFVCQ